MTILEKLKAKQRELEIQLAVVNEILAGADADQRVEEERIADEVVALSEAPKKERKKYERKEKKAAGGGPKGKKKGHACCGSKGGRHKATCDRLGAGDDPDDSEDDMEEEEAPAISTGRAKKYMCIENNHTFHSTKSLQEIKDGLGCPDCGDKTIIEK